MESTPDVRTDPEGFIDQFGDALETGEIPLAVYSDDELFDREVTRIFSRSWVFVGHESEVPEPGDYARRYVGVDPFVFVRDEHGDIRVLFNSCRHRGAQICRAEQGNASHFRCPYHGWSYRNDGTLAGIPNKNTAYKGLDPDEWGLLEAPSVDSYKGLVFAALTEDVPPLEEYLGDMRWYLDINLGLTPGGMEVVGEPYRWVADSNWKVGAENSSGDAYHTQVAHRSAIVAGFMEKDYSWEGKRRNICITECDGHSGLVGVLETDEFDAMWGHGDVVRDNLNVEALDDDQLRIARKSTVHVGNIFPNLAFIHQTARPSKDHPQRGFFSLRLQRPVSASKTEIWRWVLAPAEAPAEYKEQVFNSAMATFSPSGNFEQDDLSIWEGITEAAGSNFARNQDVTLNGKMGMEGVSDVEREPDWPGPGTAYSTLNEEYTKTFYGNWQRLMSARTEDSKAPLGVADGGDVACEPEDERGVE